jgi:hypothetical protein
VAAASPKGRPWPASTALTTHSITAADSFLNWFQTLWEKASKRLDKSHLGHCVVFKKKNKLSIFFKKL